ncbi:MAG: SEC59/DGK1/VTE5 family protein [Candidatus Micrarchaeia archaeon]
MLEIRRRAIHITFGLLLIAALLLRGEGNRELIEGVLFAVFLIGLWIIDMKLKKRKLPVVDYLLETFERPHALPAYGAFWYGMGVLLLLSFVGDLNFICASIAILALGDGFSTLIGRMGNTRFFYNKKKTLEGSIAFFIVSSFASYPFIGFSGVVLAFICSVAESIDWGVDDNFIIPLICVVYYMRLMWAV